MPEILGIGIDIVDIERIRDLRLRHGERLGHTVFLPGELAFCLARPNPDECLAARFAAKEATMKALGTGWGEGVSFLGIEVIREAGGKPGILLHGATLEKSLELGAGRIHLTLSHARTLATAQVLIEKAP